MLELIGVRNPDDKRELFKTFDVEHETWVVSDLQSKWHLQKLLLQRRGVLEEQVVMRATELWRGLAFQIMPEMRLLSPELAQTLFWNWVEPMNLPWARSSRAIPVLLKQMQMWMSIFCHAQHGEIMAQWFQDNPESFVRWGHWFELCETIWQRCLEKNLLMVTWLPAVILARDSREVQWSRPLTFDLGPQISQVEALLLRELGCHTEVRVIYPEVPWGGLMQNALKSYADLRSEAQAVNPEWQPDINPALHFTRFSTQLAEVKGAVAKIRGWLDGGVSAQKIAVVAPDIEEYWPALKMYLAQEGIPAAKPQTAKLGGFGEMSQWLATLRTALGKVSSADLEVHFFGRQDSPRLSFDEFRVMFSHVYDALDLNRARELFETKVAPPFAVGLTIQDFLSWALQFWQTQAAAPARLLALLQAIGKEVPVDMNLPPREWLSYIEGLLARRELVLQPAVEQGIWCVSLSSADWMDTSHAVFLNLNESALRKVEASMVRPTEASRIFADTGFALGSTDKQELEFEFLWFLKRPWAELQLCFAESDFAGNVQTPSRLWMWSAFVNERLKLKPQMPEPTRWDEIQRADLATVANVRALTHPRVEALTLGLQRDTTGAPITWRSGGEVRVSASSLGTFQDCPFAFAANRKLKLNDDPALDLDLDRRTRGKLLHGLLEELLIEPVQWHLSDEELGAKVEQVRTKLNVRLGDDRMWPAIHRQHVRLGRMFLQFESDWRERFPGTSTVGREVDFACYWDVENAIPTKTPGDVVLAGRLDRVDRDSRGQYALIDYKATANGLTNWKAWVDNGDIQLALYAHLLELGLVEMDRGAVVAANYYVVKDSDRRKGFHLDDPDSELYSAGDSRYSVITSNQKHELYTTLGHTIQTLVEKIKLADFNPSPRDKKLCEACAWRSLCRAPHLD